MNRLERYQSLLAGCQQGIYTDREVVGQALDMLTNGIEREALWQELTPQHREEIAHYLTNYDEAAPPLLPHGTGSRSRRTLLHSSAGSKIGDMPSRSWVAARYLVNMTSLAAYVKPASVEKGDIVEHVLCNRFLHAHCGPCGPRLQVVFDTFGISN